MAADRRHPFRTDLTDEPPRDPLDERRGIAPVVYASIAWAALVPFLVVDVLRPAGEETGCLDVCVGPPDWVVGLVVLGLPASFFALLARVAAKSDERHFGAALPRRVRIAFRAANVALVILTAAVAELLFLH